MSKSTQVQAMFDRIAPRYDLFNTVATFGRDRAWRRRSARMAAPATVGHALDAATGTGKLALELLDRAQQVTAFDFSSRMLRLAMERTRPYARTGRLRLLTADAMAMPFSDNTFDCATMGFGLRNLEDPAACLREFLRVLRPGGRLVILDISRPAGGFQLMVYRPVFRALLPLIGRAFSGDHHAYRYLAHSVDDFLSPPELTQAITAAGFVDVTYRLLHLDTITIHLGIKPG